MFQLSNVKVECFPLWAIITALSNCSTSYMLEACINVIFPESSTIFTTTNCLRNLSDIALGNPVPTSSRRAICGLSSSRPSPHEILCFTISSPNTFSYQPVTLEPSIISAICGLSRGPLISRWKIYNMPMTISASKALQESAIFCHTQI